MGWGACERSEVPGYQRGSNIKCDKLKEIGMQTRGRKHNKAEEWEGVSEHICVCVCLCVCV